MDLCNNQGLSTPQRSLPMSSPCSLMATVPAMKTRFPAPGCLREESDRLGCLWSVNHLFSHQLLLEVFEHHTKPYLYRQFPAMEGKSMPEEKNKWRRIDLPCKFSMHYRYLCPMTHSIYLFSIVITTSRGGADEPGARRVSVDNWLIYW
jgi:hypothetical protein